MQKTYHGQDGHPLGVESLPVGLTDANMVLLEQTCLEELDHKIANGEFVTGICCYRTSDISRSILETVYRYYHMMPIVSKPYLPHCLLLTLKLETSAHPLHSSAAVSNTRHQQPTHLHGLVSQNHPLSHANEIPRCRVLFFTTAEPTTEIRNLQIMSTAGRKDSQQTRKSRSRPRQIFLAHLLRINDPTLLNHRT